MNHQPFMDKCTQGAWELRNFESSGIQIWAPVNIGGRPNQEVLQPIYEIPIKPSLQIADDGNVYAMIAYEDYRQFPSPDFEAMQLANARLIICAHSIVREALAGRGGLTNGK